jgi:hypothetical protein
MRLKVGENKWASYFPQERPLDDVVLKVWDEAGDFLGKGHATHFRESGGGIFVAGRRYDSNHVLHWIYDKPQEAS